MDITLIWFPAMKLIVTAILVWIGYTFYKKEKYKTVAWYAGLIILFWIIMPIKYDGTNSVQRNIQTQEMRTQQYKNVQEEKVINISVKPTFQERMEIEEARSQKENKKVINEIIK